MDIAAAAAFGVVVGAGVMVWWRAHRQARTDMDAWHRFTTAMRR